MIILTAVCLLFLEVSEVRIRHLRFGCKIGDHFGILVQGLDQQGEKYSGWRGLLFWIERFAILDGEVCFSGWRGLLFWMERVAFLDGEVCFSDGEVCFSGWRGLLFWMERFAFLDGEVCFFWMERVAFWMERFTFLDGEGEDCWMLKVRR